MATKLNNPVKRELSRLVATKYGRIGRKDELAGMRPVVVELTSAETLVFRVKKTKRKYTLSLTVAMQLAQLNTVVQSYNEKVERYKQNKKLGIRCKKPRRPALPYNRNFFQLL
jgi:hypothetical protein